MPSNEIQIISNNNTPIRNCQPITPGKFNVNGVSKAGHILSNLKLLLQGFFDKQFAFESIRAQFFWYVHIDILMFEQQILPCIVVDIQEAE